MADSKNVRIAQCLCPARHCIVAVAFVPGTDIARRNAYAPLTAYFDPDAYRLRKPQQSAKHEFAA